LPAHSPLAVFAVSLLKFQLVPLESPEVRLADKLYRLDDNLEVDGLAKASVQDVEGPYRSGGRLLRL